MGALPKRKSSKKRKGSRRSAVAVKFSQHKDRVKSMKKRMESKSDADAK